MLVNKCKATFVAGAIDVDAYGSCDGDLCEFGAAPATVYGTSVTSSTGRTFSVNEDEGFARKVLLGSLSSRGILTVSEFTTFTDGSARKNYTNTEKFLLEGADPTMYSGTEATDYPAGNPPKPKAALLSTWSGPSGAFISKLLVAKASDGSLSLAATNDCCDFGSAVGVVYGPTITSSHGSRFLGQFTAATAGPVLVSASYSQRTDTLALTIYREFTDLSGRSNYVVHETLARD